MSKSLTTAGDKEGMMEKHVVVKDRPIEGLAGVVRAGPLIFVGGCDGHRDLKTTKIDPNLAADAEAQCENSYGLIRALLNEAKSDVSSVVRLDHVTSSQDWLPRRQAIRSRIFGKPAPLASTGIAAKMSGINMLTTAVIAVADPAEKGVLVPGATYGMDRISSAVRGGPLVFISGIRGTLDPRTRAKIPEETADSFAAQTRTCYEIIKSIMADCGLEPQALLRLDCYIRDPSRIAEDLRIRHAVLGDVPCASTTVALPLSARGETEITALAAAPGIKKTVIEPGRAGHPTVIGAGGFFFIGQCLGNGSPGTPEADPKLHGDREGQLKRALSLLEKALERCGTNLSRVVRLEVYLRDIYGADAACSLLRARFGSNPPVVSVMGADLEDLLDVKLNAIAV